MNLSVRPLPHRGESTVGYIHRLAVRNGYRDAQQLAALAANDACYRQEGVWFDLIQRWTGHTEQHLDQLPLRKSARGAAYHYVWQGVPLHRRHILKSLNYCPYCLQNNRYHRAEWQLVWKPVCEVHHCALLQHELSGAGSLLDHIQKTFHPCALQAPPNRYSIEQIRRVVALQQSMTEDVLGGFGDGSFRYNQACNYVERLVDRLQPLRRPRQAGAPLQRLQEAPECVIAGMLEGGL